MQNASFTLTVIAQLLRALLATTQPACPQQTCMPIPQDNVTIAGLTSDVDLIQAGSFDPNYIKPMDPTGFHVSTTTTQVATATRDFSSPAPMYDVFQQKQF